MERLTRAPRIAICAVILLAVLAYSGYGQFLRQFGLTVGATQAELQWEYLPNTIQITPVPAKSLWGFSGGVFAECLNVPYLSLLTELQYVPKGRTITLTATARASNEQGYVDLGPQEQNQRLHYLRLSVLAKLRIDGQVLTPYIALGPSLDYLAWHEDYSVFDEFNRAELALALVGGTEVALGAAPKLLAELRYSPSLTKAYENESVRVSNRVVQLLVGVIF